MEAETIGDMLDVSMGAEYNEKLNCMDFGAQYLRDEQGELLLKQTDEGIMENIWWTSEPLCDFDMHQIEINGKSIWVTDDTLVTPGNDSVVVTTPQNAGRAGMGKCPVGQGHPVHTAETRIRRNLRHVH